MQVFEELKERGLLAQLTDEAQIRDLTHLVGQGEVDRAAGLSVEVLGGDQRSAAQLFRRSQACSISIISEASHHFNRFKRSGSADPSCPGRR